MLSFKHNTGHAPVKGYHQTGSRQGKLILFSLVIFLFQLAGCDGSSSEKNSAAVSATSFNSTQMCSFGEALETDGHRRLALIVGVGEYKSEKVPDLAGPPNDARRFYELLTGKNGYGFPPENVCLLLDEKASTAQFKQAFDKALVARAGPDDVAVFFYAGHGSQTRDKNGDEPDEWDETFMLHDARSGGVGDLRDDEFNQMLARLHQKTKNITVIIDSCNAGTATRGPEASSVVARFFEPMAEDVEVKAVADGIGDGDAGWSIAAMPGLVVFSAATDGNPALEKNGRGIFTDALLSVMAQVGEQPLTYAQIARQVPPLVAAESPQQPYFHGNLSGPVFGNTTRNRPVAWEVIKVGTVLKLGGPALPGIGKGAEFRIYDGAVSGADTRDPAKAKATVVVTEMSGLNARAKISAVRKDSPEITLGDLAVLVRPADSFVTLKVRLRPAREPGGLPNDRAKQIRDLVAQDSEAKMLVELTQAAGDFELSVGAENHLVLRGPENRVRNTYKTQSLVPGSLWQHARQRALLHLRGEGGSEFVDNETLLVKLIPAPAAKQNKCAGGSWEQAQPNSLQVIPLCHAWNVQVALSSESSIPLLVGALILSTDGSIFALPRDDRQVRLQPGETYTFNANGETFRGTPPLDIQDRIMVFGTNEKNPVSWSLFTKTAATRGPGLSGLHRAFNRYLQPGTRGVSEVDEGLVEETAWTMSSVSMRVEANQHFLKPTAGKRQPINLREYTLANFDIRPYLPDDENTALFKVLQKADWLARSSAEDGFGYKQHDWSKSTDEENLKLGIDCSRSIWFAFTRSDLPYNRDNRFLTTAMMVTDDTLMQDEFESCVDDPNLQIGDIMVYRDDTRGDGHVVMVIDAEKRIAWGSHGWDGNPKVLPVEPDTGVEYQKIKYKQDWQRWDRKSMERKACWRYRALITEAKNLRGLPGLRSLENICAANLNCGR